MSRAIHATTVRFDDADKKLIEVVKKKYGQSSLIGALRSALRVAAAGANVAENVAPQREEPDHNPKP